MMRTDGKGRSASPHRITYKSDFHAIKCSFDTGTTRPPGTNAAVPPSDLTSSLPDPTMPHTSSTVSRGRPTSTRGAKIRDNIFLQMDSQQLKQDGGTPPSLTSGSTALVSSQPPRLQPSPFRDPKHSHLCPSSALSGGASIEPSLLEEIVEMDRAALAQKFSVTRKLFETKVMEVGARVITVRGCKGMADGRGDGEEGRGGVNHLEKEEEAKMGQHGDEDGVDEMRSSDLPVISISSPNTEPPVATSLPSRPKSLPSMQQHQPPSPNSIVDASSRVEQPECLVDSPASDASRPVSHTQALSYLDVQTATSHREDGGESACSTPEEPVRAELVDVKTDTSESDENEEEGRRKGDGNGRQDKEGKYREEMLEPLVDDVFQESGVEKSPECETPLDRHVEEHRMEPRAGEEDVPSEEENRKELSSSTSSQSETMDDDREAGRDKYQQVTEHWEGEREGLPDHNRQFSAESEQPIEEGDEREKKTEEVVEVRAAKEETGKMPEEQVDQEEKLHSEGEEDREREGLPEEHVQVEVKGDKCSRGAAEGQGDVGGGREEQTGSTLVRGIKNEAFVHDRERECQSHPKDSKSLDEESSPDHAERLSLEYYVEIPGVPKLADDQDDDEAVGSGKRKVKFATAPIKVRRSSKSSV